MSLIAVRNNYVRDSVALGILTHYLLRSGFPASSSPEITASDANQINMSMLNVASGLAPNVREHKLLTWKVLHAVETFATLFVSDQMDMSMVKIASSLAPNVREHKLLTWKVLHAVEIFATLCVSLTLVRLLPCIITANN